MTDKARTFARATGKSAALLLAAAAMAGLAGCHGDKPHDYGQARPNPRELDSRDGGLQSVDVITAADQMAASLLGNDVLRRNERWTIVQGDMKDLTRDRTAITDYDIFLQAVRSRVIKQSRGQVTWIQNRQEFNDLRNKELDNPGAGGGPQSVQPKYALTGTVRDLPRRGTIYYQMEFNLQDMNDRTTPWSDAFEVKVAR